MSASRREFLRATMLSAAGGLVFGPAKSLAAATRSRASVVGETLLTALAKVPSNHVGDRADWAAVVDRALAADADGSVTAALLALDDADPTFAGKSPATAEQRLCALLLPGYAGSRRVPAEEVQAETAVVLKAAARAEPAPAGGVPFSARELSLSRSDRSALLKRAAPMPKSDAAQRALDAAEEMFSTVTEVDRAGIAPGF